MLYKLTLEADDTAYDTVTGFLSLASQGWQEEILPDGTNRFTLFDSETKLGDIARDIASHTECTWNITTSEETDWQKKWRESIRPKKVAEFLIYPPWLSAEGDGYPICIEPKNAFGTGEHATTCLCLALLSAAHRHLQLKGPFLDLGCGSGILSIACVKLGYAGLALDIDPDAVANTRENIERNGCTASIELDCRSIREGDHAGILLANILAGPIKSMAQDLADAVTRDGILILSGFLTLQAQSVAQTYADLGLFVSRPYIEGEWAALLVSPKEELVRDTLPVDHFSCAPTE